MCLKNILSLLKVLKMRLVITHLIKELIKFFLNIARIFQEQTRGMKVVNNNKSNVLQMFTRC